MLVIAFALGMLLVGVYWLTLIAWGVYLRVVGDTWAGWRARVSDVLWFVISALALGLLIGWDRAILLAQLGGAMSAVAIVVQAILLAKNGERQAE